MRIQLLSDLHLESCAFTLKVRADADVLVLAGDIAPSKHSVRFEKLMVETMGKPTILLYGNHDFYHNTMEGAKRERTEICNRFPHVRILDDTWCEIKDVLFVGSTLWSDFQLPITVDGEYGPNPDVVKALVLAPDRGVPDFKLIALNGHIFRPNNAIALHEQGRRMIALAKAQNKPTVVCTHFLPSPLSLDPFYKGSLLNPYFASNCEDLMGGNVRAWVHGHTHHSCGYKVNGTLVSCNPRGYKNTENKNFDSQFVFDIQP